MEDTKRAKWIAVLVLVIAGGLFCRSMLSQIAADDDRAFAAGPKELEATTVSAGGLYELHTRMREGMPQPRRSRRRRVARADPRPHARRNGGRLGHTWRTRAKCIPVKARQRCCRREPRLKTPLTAAHHGGRCRRRAGTLNRDLLDSSRKRVSNSNRAAEKRATREVLFTSTFRPVHLP